ncbi:hypothetical protein [Nocardioides sp. CFH 31398]|nr:hypothetical protein [Nocardioides sp. CFH 31398]
MTDLLYVAATIVAFVGLALLVGVLDRRERRATRTSSTRDAR